MELVEELVWTDSLSMYNNELDNQHKYMFNLVNEVIENNNLYPRTDELAQLLSQISDYGLRHFKEEERLMVELKYPKYIQHRDTHRKYIYKVAMFNTNFRDPNHTEPTEVVRFIRNWWYNHIMKQDMEFSNFIRNQTLY